MTSNSDWKSVVTHAWDSVKEKVAADFPTAIVDKPLSDHTFDTEFYRACMSLNVPGEGQPIYTSQGEGTMALTKLKISAFNAVSAQQIQFSGTEVYLPLAFALLQIAGDYRYSQLCVATHLGCEVARTTVGGTGSLTMRRQSGVLTYILRVVDPDGKMQLELSKVTVTGKSEVTVQPSGTPGWEWLSFLTEIFGGWASRSAVVQSVDSFFATSPFGEDMIKQLNELISHDLKARKEVSS